MKCNCNTCCIKTKEQLKNIENLYNSCECCDTHRLKKAIPIKRQLDISLIDSNYKRCIKCNKRHIDYVMAHILKILIDHNSMNENDSIRKIGTPLITPAIHLDTLPYLSENSLVLITTKASSKVANLLINEVPELKAVIDGDTDNIAGIINENTNNYEYELLTGCDIRCDIQQTDYGSLILYKPQSKLHIEYPKKKSPKIESLDEILSKYDNPTVIDAMCGPGTLGIYSLLKNASKVLFNDINTNAIDSLKTNLKINGILDNYEITNTQIANLPNVITKKYDIGIIDAFLNEDTSEYEKHLKKICNEIIVI